MSKESLLWSLTPKAGKTSWLMGTMHVRDDRAYQLCQTVYPLILQSDIYYGEMDLDGHAIHLLSPHYSIRDQFTPHVYEKIRKQLFKSFKIDLNQFNHVHPLMIMSMVSSQHLPTDHMVSLDEHLWTYAKEHGKPAYGLESYEDQFNILHSVAPGPLYRQLKKISRSPGKISGNTERTMELYLKGRIHKLYQLSKSSMQELRKKVIYERNRNMASVIDHLDSTEQYFITAGAGHLSGKFGLIALLKKSGWKLKAHPFINGSLKEQSKT